MADFSICARKLRDRPWDGEAEMQLVLMLQQILEDGIDAIDILRHLRKRCLISDELFTKLIQKYSEGVMVPVKDRTHAFIADLKLEVTFQKFVSIIELIQAREFSKSVIRQRNRPLIFQNSMDATSSVRMINYFSQMKSIIDDNVPVDKLHFCQDTANSLLRNAQGSGNDKQVMYDKYVTMKILQMQQFWDKTFEERLEILHDMMSKIPNDIDKTYVQLVFNCEKAISHVYAGDLQIAESMVTDTLCQVETCNNSYFKALVYYDSLYVFRCLYTNTRNTDYVQKIADMCYKAIDTLEEDIEPESSLWGRMLLLHMGQTFLGIDTDLQIDYSRQLSPTNKLSATQILKSLRKNMEDMECRREMLLQLCQTRIHEEDGEIEMAIACISRALALTVDGAYYPFERTNIENYQKRLLLRNLPMPSF